MKRALALAALLNLGCGSTVVQRYLLDAPGRPHRGDVRVLMNDDRLPRDGAVALVRVVARGPDADLPHVIEALRAEARMLGCSAVVGVRIARAISTATAVGYAVRRSGGPRPRGGEAAPWSPPPALPTTDDPVGPTTPTAPLETTAPAPWSAP
jgi:hypothetical protein